MPNISPVLLQRKWTHSHEEDTDSERVYRPSHYSFPMSRGRTGFAIHPDGTFVNVGISPTDALIETEGEWKLSDDGTLAVQFKDPMQSAKKLEITSVTEDRLTIKK